jgi:hypothetical protein
MTVVRLMTVPATGASNEMNRHLHRSVLQEGVSMSPAEGNSLLLQLVLSLQFRIQLLLCSVRYVCVVIL